jgi:hypothetical protein
MHIVSMYQVKQESVGSPSLLSPAESPANAPCGLLDACPHRALAVTAWSVICTFHRLLP